MAKSKKLPIILIVVVLIVVVLGVSCVGSYNGLVQDRENVTSAQGQIQTQLQRRVDLIPNLVNTVKGYAAHEDKVYTEIADARSRLMGAGTNMADAAAANNQLTGALSRLMAISEAYPDLKANQNFINLQDELAGTENRIAVARKDYNEIAKTYNSKIKKFPTMIFAGMFGFDAAEYFEAAEGAEAAPTVEF